MKPKTHSKIVFYDGSCAFCNGFVRRLLKWDKQHAFYFASLEGITASELKLPENANSVIFYLNGTTYDQSTAVLKILGQLGGAWSIFRVLLFIPEPIRDGLYGIISRNRHKIGPTGSCDILSEEEQHRILK